MLKSPTVRLILGIVFIALVVFATFAYGRSQRDAALKSSPSPSSTEDVVATDSSSSPEASPVTSTTPATSETPAVTPATSSAASQPATGAVTSTPETGSPLDYAVPVTVLVVLFAAYRASVNRAHT